jgi:hypothetical protein
MDRFYAQLEESKRQFSETLGFNREALEKELEFKRWASEEEFDIARDRLELDRELGTRSLDLQESRIDLERASLRTEASLASQKMKLLRRGFEEEQETSEFMRETFEDLLGRGFVPAGFQAPMGGEVGFTTAIPGETPQQYEARIGADYGPESGGVSYP